VRTAKTQQGNAADDKLTAMRFHLPVQSRSIVSRYLSECLSEYMSRYMVHAFKPRSPSQNRVILSEAQRSRRTCFPIRNLLPHIILKKYASRVQPSKINSKYRVILSGSRRASVDWSRRTCFLLDSVKRQVPPCISRSKFGLTHPLTAALLCTLSFQAHAAEHITLSNGYDIVCDHRDTQGERTRLYTDPASASYVEVQTTAIVAEETIAPAPAAPMPKSAVTIGNPPEILTAPELHQVLAGAGKAHDLDVDLLASVVHAESNSHVHARSRVGAQGLMQLMPGTAAALGVHDAFIPEQNVGGGAAYLDDLLTRYRNNLAFALAAYNAGPGAVDRWHGIPPYRETRLYVARIIHEFNGRYAARQAATLSAAAVPAAKQ